MRKLHEMPDLIERMAKIERDRVAMRHNERRRRRAMAIMMRPNPDRRAVKKARRLLAQVRKFENQRVTAAISDALAAAGTAFEVALKAFASGMGRSPHRIPVFPPGDMIHMTPVTAEEARAMQKRAFTEVSLPKAMPSRGEPIELLRTRTRAYIEAYPILPPRR